MYPAINSSAEQAFDNIGEESEKNRLYLEEIKVQGMVEQAKKQGGFRTHRGNPGNALRPHIERGGRGSPDEGYN